jgi:hypothetical protein
MISSEAEREVKTIRTHHSSTVKTLQMQLDDALAELESTKETLEQCRAESKRKTAAIEQLTNSNNKLTLELRIASGGGASP